MRIRRYQERARPIDPRHRGYLLENGVDFIRSAIRIRGVQSISLLGSITTEKQDPKDIDLLVVIDDQTDLEKLAVYSRRLQGKAQQMNLGADVFLADEEGNYLGRTCHWKECRPGKRGSCEAQTCGRRPHLYDDLHVVRLKKETVQEPPVTLWPSVIRRRPLPADVEQVVREFAGT